MKADELLIAGRVEIITRTSRTLVAEVEGETDRYRVRSENNGWTCSCAGFHHRHICSHIDAVKHVAAPPGYRLLRPTPNQRDAALFDQETLP
jgi:uncharacterized Zn finger protein